MEKLPDAPRVDRTIPYSGTRKPHRNCISRPAPVPASRNSRDRLHRAEINELSTPRKSRSIIKDMPGT
jgi:hypothetical protein